MRSPITTHVLDTALGRPAAGITIRLSRIDGSDIELASGTTNDDGRIADLLAPGSLEASTYRVTFETGPYFEAAGRPVFYPEVSVVFTIRETTQHYHVPLLLSPFGYSTYRGS
ncbi:MAG: hydroxyisourate hydrolase [Acidobacteria bacterium]|nr:hydroxyisourate hydrolase [Acidobacteriota bacterium]